MPSLRLRETSHNFMRISKTMIYRCLCIMYLRVCCFYFIHWKSIWFLFHFSASDKCSVFYHFQFSFYDYLYLYCLKAGCAKPKIIIILKQLYSCSWKWCCVYSSSAYCLFRNCFPDGMKSMITIRLEEECFQHNQSNSNDKNLGTIDN